MSKMHLGVRGCLGNDVNGALLRAENLPANFFDLSSGEADAILQKLRNYRIRLAVVYSTQRVRFSSKFQKIAVEEARRGYFRLFESMEAARELLLAINLAVEPGPAPVTHQKLKASSVPTLAFSF
jgi:hypothetical protein